MEGYKSQDQEISSLKCYQRRSYLQDQILLLCIEGSVVLLSKANTFEVIYNAFYMLDQYLFHLYYTVVKHQSRSYFYSIILFVEIFRNIICTRTRKFLNICLYLPLNLTDLLSFSANKTPFFFLLFKSKHESMLYRLGGSDELT